MVMNLPTKEWYFSDTLGRTHKFIIPKQERADPIQTPQTAERETPINIENELDIRAYGSPLLIHTGEMTPTKNIGSVMMIPAPISSLPPTPKQSLLGSTYHQVDYMYRDAQLAVHRAYDSPRGSKSPTFQA